MTMRAPGSSVFHRFEARAALAFATLLLLPSAHAAAALKVGADGNFATLQSAITFAVNSGNDTEIRVETGTYPENIAFTQSATAISVSGGWNSTFTATTDDFGASTVIFGGGTARVLDATLNGGSFTIQNVVFEGGSISSSAAVSLEGGGVYMKVANAAVAQISNASFVLNSVQGSGSAYAIGGGFYGELSGTAQLYFTTNHVSANGVSSVNGNALGGGVFISANNQSNVLVQDCLIENNHGAVTGTGTGWDIGAGANFNLLGSALIEVRRSQFLSNTMTAPGANPHSGSGAFFSSSCSGGCSYDIEQVQYDNNHGGTAQFDVEIDGAASPGPNAYIADALVTRGDAGGFLLQVSHGTGNATNLTIADNAGTAIRLINGTTLTLFNTVAWNNGANVIATGVATTFGNNLIGTDPKFVDAANGDYRIRADSPARDAGDDTPPGGLPLWDLDSTTRLFGPHVDIGAYEVGDRLFANGFD